MTSASSPAALSARLDKLLVEFFSIFADIRSVRSELSSSMSDGFYELSLARHESPLLPLDQSSYAGRDMTATATISHTGGSAHSSSTATESLVFSLQQRGPGTASASLADETAASASPIRPAVFSAHLSARERKLDALIAQRGQLDDAIERQIDRSLAAADLAASLSAPTLPHLPYAPLQWFGLLPPRQLAAAQTAFKRAMEPVARLCELHERLRRVEEQWMGQLEQRDKATAEARRQAAERWRINSETAGESEANEANGAGSEPNGTSRPHWEESKEAGRGASTVFGLKPAALTDATDTSAADAPDHAMQSLSITATSKKDT